MYSVSSLNFNKAELVAALLVDFQEKLVWYSFETLVLVLFGQNHQKFSFETLEDRFLSLVVVVESSDEFQSGICSKYLRSLERKSFSRYGEFG